jgi:hypothetical protein
MDEMKQWSWAQRAAVVFAMSVVVVCCRADDRPGPTFPNLTAAEWYSLCGIWVRIEAREVNTTDGVFSWGRARHVPNFSLDIDLGANPPTLVVVAALMNIKSIDRVGPNVFSIKAVVRGMKGGDREENLVANLRNDGTLLFTDGASYFGGPGVVFVKLDGPKTK